MTVTEMIGQMLIHRNHGIERKSSTKRYFNWRYVVKNPSFNFRLSELNCALGFAQLDKVSLFIKKRVEIAKIYNKIFESDKCIEKFPQKYSKLSNCHKKFEFCTKRGGNQYRRSNFSSGRCRIW